MEKNQSEKESIVVRTKAGVFAAYKNTEPGKPGITVMFTPEGIDEEIDMAQVFCVENPKLRSKDKEKEQDAVILIYGDVWECDPTDKYIMRRSEIIAALGDKE